MFTGYNGGLTMKKFYYATLDKNGNARVLTVCNENLTPKIKNFNLVIVHPCATFKEAVKIVEAWREAQQ
jgi:hypothetical protein